MREHEYSDLPLEVLTQEYQKRCAALHSALVGGALWDEVKDQRYAVTLLAQEIHWRSSQLSNPAESSGRDNPDRNFPEQLL